MGSTDVRQRGETDFFSGEPLRALSTLVFSDNVDLQRSASLTFAEITERGKIASVQYTMEISSGASYAHANELGRGFIGVDGQASSLI
jgi:hypothetical protein